MNKTINIKALAAAAITAAIALSSCVKDDLYNTSHPDYGVAAVALVLPEGVSSEGFYIEISNMPHNNDDGTYYFSHPLTPGEHDVLVHNNPEGMNVVDGIATVNAADGSTRALDELIEPLPHHLYSGTERVVVVADDTTRIHLDIVQRTRDLHIELTITEGDPERIVSITGTLQGIAGAYDMWSEALYGEPVSASPAFTRSGATVTADLRILGILGSVQRLILHIVFTDGRTQDVESDLASHLGSFNGGTTTFTLAAELHTPIESGFEATITDWTEVDNGNIDIH